MKVRNFPGGPVIKNPHCHCRRHRFNPWSGELRSCMPCGMAKINKMEVEFSIKSIFFLSCDIIQYWECQQPYVCRWRDWKNSAGFSNTLFYWFVPFKKKNSFQRSRVTFAMGSPHLHCVLATWQEKRAEMWLVSWSVSGRQTTLLLALSWD